MSFAAPSVLMIGWEYPPHNSGGLGVACEGLTQALAGANSQIYFTLPYHHQQIVDHMQLVACTDPDQPDLQAPPFLSYATGPKARSVATPEVLAGDWQGLPVSDMEQRVVEYAHLVQDQARQLKQKFAVIHAHDWMSLPAAVDVKQATGRPLITHIHSTEYDRIPNGHGSPYIIKTERDGLLRSDKIIAVSYYTKHILVRMYGIHPDKIEVVHNGLMPLRTPASLVTPFAARQPVVVFMGRLTMQKGPDYFLELAHHVLDRVPQALFVMAGHGDMYQELLLKTAAQRLTASVLFSGFLRDKQRELLLNRADVFVMPSLSEPFGLVALEAAQRHTPVIVSKNAGVSEVLPSALSVDFWDMTKMADMIVELITNRSQAQLQVSAQDRDLASITWDKAAQKVQRIYRNVFLGK